MDTARPSRPYTIVTGASRGLGLALVRQLLDDGHRVLALSRGEVPIAHPGLLAWSVDLAEPVSAAGRLAVWLDGVDPRTVASVTLVNNAGVISELAPLGDVAAADLSNALRVGLEAPMLLASAFLRATAAWSAPRKILFVSSGLGRRAMAGSASYCAAKAGMDHLARAIALEEAQRPNGARVVSIAPGVVDTGMQVQLRGADPSRFPDRARFVGLHENGQLDSPASAAAKLLRYLARPDFGAQPVADVRDA